ncbi:MAG: hypothetical protein PHV42_03570 [Candidatus Pacebacteria bacterium]|nr:hypothetical protein [Candidatus Paceibacterota bacterium]
MKTHFKELNSVADFGLAIVGDQKSGEYAGDEYRILFALISVEDILDKGRTLCGVPEEKDDADALSEINTKMDKIRSAIREIMKALNPQELEKMKEMDVRNRNLNWPVRR